jgi:hypothetical protein
MAVAFMKDDFRDMTSRFGSGAFRTGSCRQIAGWMIFDATLREILEDGRKGRTRVVHDQVGRHKDGHYQRRLTGR